VSGIEDVAARAGVSTATVSRALNDKGHVSAATRARVEEAAAELGYVVSASASSLASGRTRNVGVVIPFLNRWFFSTVIEGAQHALLAGGYDLTLYNLGRRGEQRLSVFEHFLLRRRVDAVIAVSLELTPDETIRLLDMRKPIVGIGGPIPGVRTLSVDNIAVSRLATEHLLALGHRRIAHLGGDETYDHDFHQPTNRRVGYELALQAAGIPVDPALYKTARFTIQDGHRATKELLKERRNRPTAIFAASDEMAFGALLAARELGISVPGDLSVIGIDDHELSAFFGLSTVAQFPAMQGMKAVEILLEQLNPGHRKRSAVDSPLPYELIVRSSTAAPPSH
jgi:LacI family transcriptional regulator, repressor for deo operon, udp, cdd, tsx, nupC, and nupG